MTDLMIFKLVNETENKIEIRDLEKPEIEAAVKHIEGVIRSQMASFPGCPFNLLANYLGGEEYYALVRDIAANIVQTLL